MSNTLTETAPVALHQAAVTISTKNFTLNTLDRCDTCNAQAYYKVNFKAGSLLFCNHHYTAKTDALSKNALTILDESAQFRN